MATICRPILAALLLLTAGCDRSVQFIQKSPEPEAYVADPGSLGFDIAQVQGTEYIATYSAHGKIARFRIQLDPTNRTPKNFDVGKADFSRNHTPMLKLF